MEKIIFEEWNKVVIVNYAKVMTTEEFFAKLEENLEDSNYTVYYDDNKMKYIIIFQGGQYEAFFDETMDEYTKRPIVKKLEKLASIQKMIDIANGNEELMVNGELDEDAKKIYLSQLRNKYGFSLKNVKKYLHNYISDLKKSWSLIIKNEEL